MNDAEDQERRAEERRQDYRQDIRQDIRQDERRQDIRRQDDVAAALQKRDIETLYEKLAALERELGVLQADRQKAFIWGIGVLGSLVLMLFGWLVTFASKRLGL